MSEVPLLIAVFWAALNPPASMASLPADFAGLASDRRARLLIVAWGAAIGLLALVAALHQPLFDLLEVSAPSFDVAAGLVMLVGAMRPLLRGRAIDEHAASMLEGGRPLGALAPLAVPLLATPAALAAAISYGERAGTGPTIAVAAGLVTVGALGLWVSANLASSPARAVVEALARLTGALLIAVAVGLIVDGVLTI